MPKYRVVCRTKQLTLLKTDDEEEAYARRDKHRELTGHVCEVYEVPDTVGHVTGGQLVNREVPDATRLS